MERLDIFCEEIVGDERNAGDISRKSDIDVKQTMKLIKHYCRFNSRELNQEIQYRLKIIQLGGLSNILLLKSIKPFDLLGMSII